MSPEDGNIETNGLAVTHRSRIRFTTPPPEGSSFSKNRILISCCFAVDSGSMSTWSNRLTSSRLESVAVMTRISRLASPSNTMLNSLCCKNFL